MPVLAEPRSTSCVLAFDTSTEVLALGVHSTAGAFTVLAAGGAQASTALLPQAHALLQRAGCTLGDVQAIAFGAGPGAFTGLRTACAVAQGLGLGLRRPLLPIDSLLVVAEDARVQTAADDPLLDIAVVMDARMDEVYAGRYRWAGDGWQVLDVPALWTPAALAEDWADVALSVLCGSALAAFGARLAVSATVRVEHEQDRAAALLRLAMRAALAGQGIDAAEALPLYLRDKVAYTTAERDAARKAPAGAAAPA